jgi:hypothetical protein
MFISVWLPPAATGMTWSISSNAPIRQYTQLPPTARSHPRRRPLVGQLQPVLPCSGAVPSSPYNAGLGQLIFALLRQDRLTLGQIPTPVVRHPTFPAMLPAAIPGVPVGSHLSHGLLLTAFGASSHGGRLGVGPADHLIRPVAAGRVIFFVMP